MGSLRFEGLLDSANFLATRTARAVPVLRATYRRSRCRVIKMGSLRFEELLDSASFLATRTARAMPVLRATYRQSCCRVTIKGSESFPLLLLAPEVAPCTVVVLTELVT